MALEQQRLQPDILQSKHENTHMRNTQRRFSLDIRQLREKQNKNKKKNIPHTSWTPMRYDHKAVISISISKDNHAFPIGQRIGNEGFMSECYNIKSNLLFYLSSVTQLSTTFDTCWTFNGPRTHTHTHTHARTHTKTILILTLTCSETSHPLLGMITLRKHPALAPTPRA